MQGLLCQTVISSKSKHPQVKTSPFWSKVEKTKPISHHLYNNIIHILVFFIP